MTPIKQAHSPKKTPQNSDCEQGVLLLQESKQVGEIEDKEKKSDSNQSVKGLIQAKTSGWSVKDIVQTLCMASIAVFLLVLIIVVIWGAKIVLSGKL